MTDGSNLVLRRLDAADYHKGFLQLLGQLSVVGDVSEEQFQSRFSELSGNPDYYTVVIEDQGASKIVATASLIVERKFLRSCGKCGHIEDVVVADSYRGKKLGQRVLAALTDTAKEAGCYKIILDCSEDNAPFYEKCGLSRKEIQMVKYLAT
mmetsp:Transcript_7000/g.18819  ORF Transcript_7000/g.18819 Transcript_7000/m.18819 type:complete len:152 (+) Transcript_7000:59-514(+)